MAEPMIEIRGLYKIFADDPLAALALVRENGVGKEELLDRHGAVLGLADINLAMPARGIQVVMGLSGSGKSTLIRHINRLIEPTAGQVLVDGVDVVAMSKADLRQFRLHKASMVFQRFGLLPHRSVADNVAFGLRNQGVGGSAVSERVGHWLERVGLTGYGEHFPTQLSGGMQQRVGLARALATDADILLMDEAFSALDPLIRNDMQDVLLELQAELHKTIVFITHDLHEALRIGDNIAILRDGEIIQQGDPQQIVLEPADNYIADFVRDINRGRVIKVESIMQAPETGAAGPKLPADTLLEDAARVIADAGGDMALVTNASGRVVGAVSASEVMGSMVRQEPDAVPAENPENSA